MATILVTGGAGYVGSHCSLALHRAGHKVVVYDNLSNGHAQFAKWGALVEGDIRDKAQLSAAFAQHKPDAVLHCAALIEVGESVKHPARFYDVNVAGALSLLEAMREAGVDVFAFSSTCATYGEPQRLPMDETHRQAPINPYGWSKLMSEWMLRDAVAAHGLNAVVLRYFNVAGADPGGRIGQSTPEATHLIKVACEHVVGKRDFVSIFGTDYDTPDGSGIRDYIHVEDLASAHLHALVYLRAGGRSTTLNCGYGAGNSVREVLAMVATVAGRELMVHWMIHQRKCQNQRNLNTTISRFQTMRRQCEERSKKL